MSKHYTIYEYQSFVSSDRKVAGYINLPADTFDALENFILQGHQETRGQNEAIDFLTLSARKGVGRIITAKNYVGVVVMKDGTTIEILPKVSSFTENENLTKRVFLDMLRTLKEAPFKTFEISNLHVESLNVLEIFIGMFISETTQLCKLGLRSGYVNIHSNVGFFRGKLLVSEHLKKNLLNKERFYTAYDEFIVNRPENRLIKSTLHYLFGISQNSTNRKKIRKLLMLMDTIPESSNVEADLSKCVFNRSMAHYEQALSWCRVFLKRQSFTSFSGSAVALALLFPMEKVFESYIGPAE